MEQDTSRRQFLKKAGTVAWVVPTIQVVNMSAAMAGGDGAQGSVVVTTTQGTEPPRCYCELNVSDVQQGDLGIQFKIELHLSEGCQGRADNVSISLNGAEPDNYPLMPYYRVTVPFEAPSSTATFEVHDNQGTILTTCSIDLNLEA